MPYMYHLWAITHQNSFFRLSYGPGTFYVTMYTAPVTPYCTTAIGYISTIGISMWVLVPFTPGLTPRFMVVVP